MEKEWRYSSSLAESILFETLNEKQEKVYYPLHTVHAKHLKEKIAKMVILSYNVKTAMFWMLEQKASYWVENDVDDIFDEIFRLLHRTLVDGCAPYYFQPKHNLFI